MSQLAARLAPARAQTDALFALLDPAALYERPVCRSPPSDFLSGPCGSVRLEPDCRNRSDKPSFHPAFDKLFAFGIDPEPGGAPADQPSDWPSEQEVRSYGARVRRELDAALAQVPEQLLHVAIEHR